MKSILHYTIEGKIGEGGMGEVFLATDTRLDRKVALKFLPESLRKSPEARERLLREARAASRLSHPNIVMIHAVEQAEGRDFIAMEYVQGDALDAAPGARRDLPTLLETALGIAGGLTKAHEAGIVHRDLKPANILVDADGRARILDFGVATIEGASRLTQTGSTVGTMAYMSPEQAQGRDVDARSDLFSFGVMFYELLAGCAPFAGEHQAAVLYAIVNEEPKPLNEARADVPQKLAQAIHRCLEKNPERRYASAGELVRDLQDVRDDLVTGKKKAVPGEAAQPASVAVLPFTNMSADAEQEYFCDGIAEDIINHLCHIHDLHVAARTSAFAFKGKSEDVREIGRRLNVDHILEGSVRKAGNRLRITAQLIKVADGFHTWSERYDRELDDVFAIQDEISENIAQALQVRLSDHERRVLRAGQTSNVDAYDLYLRARRLSRMSSKDRRAALGLLREAIAIDPEYASAHAGMSELFAGRFLYLTGDRADVKAALEHGLKALELDPDLAEAHAAHAYALSLDEHFEESDREFDRAIELNPNLYEAYYGYARTCFARGQLEKAASLYEKAAQADPEDYQALVLAAMACETLKQRDRGLAAARNALKRIDKQLASYPDDVRALALGAGVLQALGDRERALAWAERCLFLDPGDVGVLYNTACFFSRTGMTDRALETLEKARMQGFAMRTWMERDPDLDPIRDDPRFQEILAQIPAPGTDSDAQAK